VCEFLEKIVENNKGKIIVLVLDNSRAHHSNKTITKARELGIILVFLPPYSPDLNPVEYVWKTIKREVSVTFIQSKEHLRTLTPISCREYIVINIFFISFFCPFDCDFQRKWIEKYIHHQ
jgi:transposase